MSTGHACCNFLSDSVHRVACLYFRKNGLRGTGPPIPLSPFAALAPDFAAFHLDDHNAPRGVEYNKVTFSLRAYIKAAGITGMNPTKRVNYDDVVWQGRQRTKDTLLTKTAVEIRRFQGNACHTGRPQIAGYEQE